MNSPTIVATGLVCLDVIGIESQDPPALTAGGFPNMLILLHTRGWRAIPVGEVGSDRAADYALNEIAQWGVDTHLLRRCTDILTPVYVLYHQDAGHRFGKECPYCRMRFPLYVPPREEIIPTVLRKIPSSIDVFYFDKVSRAALRLARTFREQRTLIMFEPNRIDDPALFRECVAVSDILKYSSERRAGFQDIIEEPPIPMLLETAGKEGLRYRIISNGMRRPWQSLPALSVQGFQDAAGAGDWLTASILHDFVRRDRFVSILENPCRLEEILFKGQQSSAYNCRYVGARGGLYAGKSMPRGFDFCPNCLGKSRNLV